MLEIMLELMFSSETETKAKSRNKFNYFRLMTDINRIGGWSYETKNIFPQ